MAPTNVTFNLHKEYKNGNRAEDFSYQGSAFIIQQRSKIQNILF